MIDQPTVHKIHAYRRWAIILTDRWNGWFVVPFARVWLFSPMSSFFVRQEFYITPVFDKNPLPFVLRMLWIAVSTHQFPRFACSSDILKLTYCTFWSIDVRSMLMATWKSIVGLPCDDHILGQDWMGESSFRLPNQIAMAVTCKQNHIKIPNQITVSNQIAKSKFRFMTYV